MRTGKNGALAAAGPRYGEEQAGALARPLKAGRSIRGAARSRLLHETPGHASCRDIPFLLSLPRARIWLEVLRVKQNCIFSKQWSSSLLAWCLGYCPVGDFLFWSTQHRFFG